MLGTVSNMVTARKYGFISGDDGSEYFFHTSDTIDWDEIVTRFNAKGGGTIRVAFKPVKTPKGLRARTVNLDLAS